MNNTKSNIILTKHQKEALNDISAFLHSDMTTYTLIGCAGSGKTTLTKKVLNIAAKMHMSVIGVAPTHKARKVLHRILNQNTFKTVDTTTISSLLNKTRNHSYVGTKSFTKGEMDLFEYDLLIIDECSMISDTDASDIIKYAKLSNTKILFVGDNAQIPNPTQIYIKSPDIDNQTIIKKDSISFEQPKSVLSDIIRQKQNNPLIEVLKQIRTNLYIEPDINRDNSVIDGENGEKCGIIFTSDSKAFVNKIKELFVLFEMKMILDRIKIITYTNNNVQKYNKYIRQVLGKNDLFVKGDLLMGYNNVGFPMRIIENGQDYIVMKVKMMRHHPILQYLVTGYLLSIKELGGSKINNIFIPDINSDQNNDFLENLTTLANKVNNKGSSKIDFINYMKYKNKVIFIENIYKFDGNVLSESQFKQLAPILFKSTDTCIKNVDGKLQILENSVSQEIENLYPGLLSERITDKRKTLSDNERFADRFQIIEKDIDYGYSITAHKSQGSTYHTVFIDESDFDKIQNRWNHKYNAYMNAIKEKNQLKYVAYSRPEYMAIVYYK